MIDGLDPLCFRYGPTLASIVASIEHHLLEHHLPHLDSLVNVARTDHFRAAPYAGLSSILTSLAASALNPCEIFTSFSMAETLYAKALCLCPINEDRGLKLGPTDYASFMGSISDHQTFP